jgi:hypothetical protein
MPLENISYLRYLQPYHPSGATLSQENWDARVIVEAIKGDNFKGYANVNIGVKRYSIDYANRLNAIEWFADMVKKDTAFKGNYTLCPIPDSTCTVKAGRCSKVQVLAERLAASIPNLSIWDGLRFIREMPKSRTTGMRDEATLFKALRVTSSPPDEFIILLDDVCTTGAHARAAARILQDRGVKNICAMSVARTMLLPDEKVYGYRSDPLVAE